MARESLSPTKLSQFLASSTECADAKVDSAAAAAAAAAQTRSKSSDFSELNDRIASHYDAFARGWTDVWGEHMHRGFYDAGLPLRAALFTDDKQAQIRMIEESLKWAGLSGDQEGIKPQKIIDVGCGIGGSSRYLARKFNAEVVGIALSPQEVQRATELSTAAGLSSKVSFQVADALNQPFPDEHFDFVWSMESGVYMPDKEKFMSELVRVTKPGGQILLVTWCHRELSVGEKTLKSYEQELLNKICEAYHLPGWCAPSRYVSLAQSMGLQDTRSSDWTDHITMVWPVIASTFGLRGMMGLLKFGWTAIKGALPMMNMVKGYNSGLIKYTLITARKPV